MQFASAIGLDKGAGLRVLPVLGVKTHVLPTAPSPTITHLMLVFEAMVACCCVEGRKKTGGCLGRPCAVPKEILFHQSLAMELAFLRVART